MRSLRRNSLIFLIGCLMLCAGSQFFLMPAYNKFLGLNTSVPELLQKYPTLPPTQQQNIAPPQTCTTKRAGFETGISFPQWTPEGYGSGDIHWAEGIQTIRSQTGACWIEMPLLFYQETLTSTTITTGPSTPTLDSLSYGIRLAHYLGFHVFITFLLTVSTGPQAWSGSISFTSYQQEQQWFTSYWQTLKPYVTVAAQAGAEQLAIGTEYEWLQRNAPDDLWNGLIANMKSIYQGTLTYDINWTDIQDPIRQWMRNPDLQTLGVSAYAPLIDTRTRVDPKQIPTLWQNKVKVNLDNLSVQYGKPIFISEIGYRNSSDALYNSWESTSSAPSDPEEQAAACEAALVNVIPDPHISGIFFWGWDDVGAFSLTGLPAVNTIHSQYLAA